MQTLIEILDELGIEHKGAGESKDVRSSNVGIRCPFCGRGDFSLAVFPNVTTCWRCGKHRLGDSLAEASGKSLHEVLKLLDGYRDDREPEPERRGRLVLPKGIGPFTRCHRTYLESRGIDPSYVETVWGVQGIAIAPRLAWRLFIPIKDRSERMVSWTTRTLLDCKDRRYIGASPDEEIESPKRMLYGEHLAGHGIVVVEGPTDVWRIGAGAVATLGVSWTDSQLACILRHPVRAVLFDREPEAQRRARRLCNELAAHPGRTVLVELETGSDPGDCAQAEIDQIRREFLR